MASNYVGLNVGGVTYLTSRETLTRNPDSFFTLMLSDQVPSAKDSRGNYLIDRDGGIFRHVLNFMRCGKLMLPGSFSEFYLLASEAEFFQLQALKILLEDRLPSRITISIAENYDSSIYKKVELVRKTLAEEPAKFVTELLNGAWNLSAANGELYIQENFPGDYALKGDADISDLIMGYLEKGEVYRTVFRVQNSETFQLLKKQACHFRLDKLLQHIVDVEYILSKGSQHEKMYALLYYYKNHNFVLYSSSNQSFGKPETYYQIYMPISWNISVDYRSVYGRSNHQSAESFLNHPYRNMQQGLPRLKTVSSKEDVIAYLAEIFKGCQMERTQLSDDCTKVEYIL